MYREDSLRALPRGWDDKLTCVTGDKPISIADDQSGLESWRKEEEEEEGGRGLCSIAPTPPAASAHFWHFHRWRVGGGEGKMLEPVVPAGQVKSGTGCPFSRLTPLLFL